MVVLRHVGVGVGQIEGWTRQMVVYVVDIAVGQTMTEGLELVGDGDEDVWGIDWEDEDPRLGVVVIAVVMAVLVLPRVGLMARDAEVEIVANKVVLEKAEVVSGWTEAEDNGVNELEVDPTPAPFVNESLVVIVAVPSAVELEVEDPRSRSAIVLL